MPHGREHAAAADRTTNENENDDGGDRPWNNPSRTPRSSCSRMGNGSSSAAATVVAWGVPLAASASATSVVGYDHCWLLTVVVVTPSVTDLAALASAAEVAVPEVARAKPESVSWHALAVKDFGGDAAAVATGIGNADYDYGAMEVLRHRCHIGCREVVVCPGRRRRQSRNPSCWHRPRCTSF